jgi:hypothetical protein
MKLYILILYKFPEAVEKAFAGELISMDQSAFCKEIRF